MNKVKQRPNRKQVDSEKALLIMQAARKLAEQGTAELIKLREEREGRGEPIEYSEEKLNELVKDAEKAASEGTKRMDEREKKYNEERVPK